MNALDRRRQRALRLNRWTLGLARHWLKIALVVVGIFAALPWIAPTLMHFGLTGPARALYTVYSPFCHQFAFRSIFLYGDQTFYPRAVSGTTQLPFEVEASASAEWQAAVANWVGIPGRSMFASIETFDPYVWSPDLQFAAREFLGSEQMGYKTTLCARDMASYTMLFVGMLIYSIPVVRRRLRPAPVLLYILLGLAPIGIDGMSQLLGYAPFNLWPPRETDPIFRVVTGGLFGLMNAWLGLPYLEASFKDTRQQIEIKLLRAGLTP